MKPSPALVTGITAAFVALVSGAVVVIVIEPQQAGTMVPILAATLAPTIASLAGLARLDRVDRRTHDLTNGLLDAKIRAAVADVIQDRATSTPEPRSSSPPTASGDTYPG